MKNSNSIILLSNEEIYDLLYSSINRIFRDYYSFFMNKDTFKKQLFREFDIARNNYDSKIDYVDYINSIMKAKSIKIVRNIVTNEDKAKKILSNLTNNICSSRVDNLKRAEKILGYLGRFISTYHINLSYEVYSELLRNNDNLNNIVGIVFKDNKDNIINGRCDEVFNSYFLVSLMEIYAANNNIEIKNEPDAYSDSFYTNDAFKIYIKDVTSYPLLTSSEEIALARKIKYCDKDSAEYKEAKDLFISSNLRLVIAIAKKYINKGLDYMDIIQEGNFGLMTAVDRFDVDKGFKFSTYATWWIKQAISRALAVKSRNIRLPVHISEKLYIYNREVSKLNMKLNHDATIEEIVKYLGYTEKEIKELESIKFDTVSYNEMVGEDSDFELLSLLSDDDDKLIKESEDKDLRKELIDVLQTQLSEREAYILAQRFGFITGKPMTLEAIGKEYGITRERVRQIEGKALIKIRRNERLADELSTFTDDPEKSREKVKNYQTYDYENRNSYTGKFDSGRKGGKIKYTTIYEFFKRYPHEVVDKAVAKLNKEDKALLEKRFSDDVINYRITLDDAEKTQFNINIINKLKRYISADFYIYGRPVSTNYEVEKPENTEKKLPVMSIPSDNELLSSLDPKESIIAGLKLGYYDDKIYTNDDISKLLGLTTEEVKESTKKILSTYKQNLNNVISMGTDTVSNKKNSLVKKK